MSESFPLPLRIYFLVPVAIKPLNMSPTFCSFSEFKGNEMKPTEPHALPHWERSPTASFFTWHHCVCLPPPEAQTAAAGHLTWSPACILHTVPDLKHPHPLLPSYTLTTPPGIPATIITPSSALSLFVVIKPVSPLKIWLPQELP